MTDTKKNPLTTKLKTSTSRLGLRALEPRILLDAAGFVTGVDVAMDALDTQNVAEDMAAIFDSTLSIAPNEQDQQVELLISALNAADAEVDKEVLATRPIDDGGKNYALIQADADIDKEALLTRPLDDGGKNYELVPLVPPSGSDINIALGAHTLNEQGLIEISAEDFDAVETVSSVSDGTVLTPAIDAVPDNITGGDKLLGATLIETEVYSTVKVESLVDTDGDGVADDDDIDDDNDGILDVDEGNGGTFFDQFNNIVDEIDTDGVFGFSTSVAELDGREITTGQGPDFEDGDRSPLFSEGDVITYSLNGGTRILAISIDSLSPDAEIGIRFRDSGSNPNIELRGVSDAENAEERAGLSLRFFDANDPAFAGADGLGEIAQIISAGGGEPEQVTSSIRISDIDLDGRLEGVSASLDSLASYTLEGNNGSFTPVVEDGFVVFRGTVVDPTDNVQLNFLNTSVFEINLLNNQNSRAGFSFNFSQFNFDTVVTTTTGLDSDGDGIDDHLDIDSDNDGITDNIEAQTTNGFIAPNADDEATLASNEGLNSAFVGTNGLAPVDTDNDGNPDVLDTDSDNEGANDTIEAGLTGTAAGLSDASTDADGDGLFDVFDTQNGTAVDDGFNVNEGFVTGAAALLDGDNDASGNDPLSEDVDFRDAILPLDTDGDGVADEVDVDDDNDGILDVDEGVQRLQVQGQLQFNHNENGGQGIGPSFVEFGGSPRVSDVIASGEDTVIGAGLTVLMTGQGTDNASLFEFDLDGADSNTFEEALANDDFIEMSFTTQDTLSSLRFLFHSFSAQDAGGSNRGDYRVTYLISDDGFETSDVLVDDFQFQSGTSGSFNGQFPPFEEYALDPETRYSVRVYVYDAQNNPAGQITFNDQTFEFNQVIELDSDNDGIVNRLDIDSDNDGITDNIEAQTTADYIAPSGIGGTPGFIDVNQDGLDDAYDNRNSDNGDTLDASSAAATSDEAIINPVNTDGDNQADFLDTNSDNEGGNDTAEAGLTGFASGLSTSSNDADGDGLFDVFDTQNNTSADDGFVVNEGLDTGATTFPDADGDASGGVPLTADVDFRDAQFDSSPPTAQDDSFETNEDAGVSGNVLQNNGNGVDSDPNGHSFAVTQVNGVAANVGNPITLPSGALLTLNSDGSFDYDPNGAFDFLDTDEVALDTFEYTIDDQVDGTDSAIVTLTITGDNDTPTIDLNGALAGTDFSDVFVEDEPGQPLTNLVSFDAVIQDDEDNISAVNIIPSLPVQNDGTDEYLRIDSAGIDLSIRLIDGEIIANTPLVFGDTTFAVTYLEGQISITNADGGTLDSDDLQGFLRLLAYENVNQDNSDGIRAFNFQVVDPAGVTVATSTITVDRVNDAPVPTVAANSDGTVVEFGLDTPEAFAVISPDNLITEISVAELLAQLDISDVEDSNFGIGIIGADETQGVWQYIRPDIEGHEWTDFQLGDLDNSDATPIPDGEALLLDPDTIIRFVADPGFSSDAALVFRVWDQTVGEASNPPSTVIDDSGASAPFNTSSLSTAAFAISLAADTDGDGIINSADVDDDNDGILDVDEGFFQELESFETPVQPNIGNNVIGSTFGNFSLVNGGNFNIIRTDGNVIATGPDAASDGDQYAEVANASDSPLSQFVLLANGQVDVSADFSNRSGDFDYTDWTGAVEILDENFNVIATGNSIDFDQSVSDENWFESSLSVSLEAGTYYFRTFVGNSGNIDNLQITAVRDTDGDGIADHLDIDSDDDGITDNIEAQSTDGYIAPSGSGTGITDVNQDGLDDNYDARNGSLTTGSAAATSAESIIVPQDTDGLGNADYLDSDSDDDGISDATENGLGVIYAAGDTDGDGLADVYEAALDGNVNDGFVVNEGISPLDGTLPDTDGDAGGVVVAGTADLDYRDIFDTDGDGVADNRDIDDDNDGILDTVEGDGSRLTWTAGSSAGVGAQTATIAFSDVTANLTVSTDTGLFRNTADMSLISANEAVLGQGIYTIDSDVPLNDPQIFIGGLGTDNSQALIGNFTLTLADGTVINNAAFEIIDRNGEFSLGGADTELATIITVGGSQYLTDPTNNGGSNQATALIRFTDLIVSGDVFDPNNAVTQITFENIGDGIGPTFVFGLTAVDSPDTDGDGITNRLDIDSDNDGITDNVEAQTTAGYIAPSGQGGTPEFTDVDGDGLDDNYDADTSVASTSATSVGLTPVNTDAGADTPDDTPDFLDTDSDNDGLNDTVEAGLGTTPATGLSDAATDTDGDGLFDVFEDTNVNDGFDVNDTNLDVTDTNFNLPGVPALDADGGNAVPLVTDLLFRDVDDAPIIVAPLLPQTGFDSMAQVPFDASVGFSDPEGEALAFSSPDLPAWMSIDPVTGIITGTPPADTSQGGLAGEYIVTVVATDPNGNSVSQTVTYNFSNPAPIIDEAIFNRDLIDGDMVTIDSGFVDPDGDVLTYTAAGLPTGLTINPATGEIIGELAIDASQGGPNSDGIYTVVVTADDGEGGIATDTFAITVTNPAPGAVDDNLGATEDASITGNVITANDSDPDGDALTVSAVNGAAANVGTAIAGSDGGLFTVDANGDISFDPNGEFEALDAGETATTTLSYTVSDGEGGTDIATVTVTVTGQNDAPVVTGTLTPQTGTDGVAQLPFDASTAFSDVDGESLAFTSDDLPPWMSINPATGIITGTPPADASQGGANSDGIYTVTVTATDPDGEEVSTTVTYSFANPAPVVDTAVGPQTGVDGEAVSITPDFVDPDGDALTYTATGLPAGLSIDPATGEITGTLEADASQLNGGVYPITITANDGEGGTVTDTFDLTVTNPAPDAVDDALSATEDASITGNVITANDSDPDGDTLTVSAVNGAAANVGTAIAGSDGGLFTINPDGSYVFETNGEFEGLDIGETATTTVTYTIDDGEGGTDTATVTVTVTGQNDAPVLINPLDPNDPNPAIPDQVGNDSEVLPDLNLADFFTDPDAELIFFDIEGEPSWLTVNNFTGVVTATTTPADASQGGPNGDGVYPITIVASDPDGVETRVVVNYVIDNPAPIAQDDVRVAAEDGPGISGNVISDDTGNGVDIDPDGDVLSVAEVNGDTTLVGQPVTGSTGGEFTINPDGSYSFDPSGDFEYLATGETETTSVTYLVSDNEGGTDLATVTVTVEGANDAPIPVDPSQPAGPSDPTVPFDPQDPRDPPLDPQNFIPAQTGDDSAPFTPFDLTPFFGDPDGSDVLTLSVNPADLPDGLVFDPVTGILSGTPSSDASQGGVDGVYTIAVTATDPSGETFTTNLEVTINNPAPIALDDADTTDEDTVLSGSVFSDNGNGVDSDPDGDVINVSEVNGTPITSGSVITLPSGALLTINDDGSYDYNPNGQFEGLAVGETAVDSFTYQITDNQGGVSEATVTLTIDGVNDAPIPVDPSQPAGPSDPTDPSDPQDPRDPPVDPLNFIPAQTAEDGSPVTPLDLTPFFGDPDGSDDLTLSLDPADLPDGLVFDPVTGILSGTPSSDASQGGTDGVYTIAVTATDPSGETFTTNVTFTVTNPAPVAVADNFSTPEDTPLTVNVIDNNDSDPDGDTLVIDAVALPDGTIIPVGTATEIPQGTLTVLSDGTVTLEPARDLFGPVVFGYTLSDGQGGTDVATVTIDVTPVNDAPIPVDPTQSVVEPNNPNFPTDPEDPREPPLDPNNYIPVQTGSDSAEVSPLDLTPFFGDPDPMEVLTLSLDPAELPDGLSFDPNTGTISGTPTSSASQGGDPANPGTYVIAVTATDSNGESFTTNVTYMIDNPAPDAVDDNFDVSEDANITGQIITGSDIDPDGDVLTVTQVGGDSLNVAQPIAGSQGGLFTIDANGELSFATNGEFEDLDVGETRLTAITYEISDGEGGFDTATVTVTVMGANDAPIVTGTLAPQTGDDGMEQLPLDASTIFDDVDGEPLTFTSVDLPVWMTIDPVTGIITGTPPADASQGGANSDGVYLVTVTATDPDGESVSATVAYTFTNLIPVAVNDDVTTDEDTTLSGNVIAPNDTDPDGDVLMVSSVDGRPANVGQSVEGSLGGEFTINSDGSYDFDPAGDFNTLAVGETLVTTVTYEVSDGEGGTDTATVSVTVTGTNDGPIPVDPSQPVAPIGEPNLPVDPSDPRVAPIDPNNFIPAQTGSDSSDVTPLDLTPFFGDPDGSDSVSLSIDEADLPAGLNFDPVTGILSGTLDPSASQGAPNGVFEIPVTATDESGETFTTILTYTVTNPAPIVDTAIGAMAASDGDVISIPSDISDPDGDVLTYSATGLPAGLSIDPATGEITGTVDSSASQGGPNADGVYTITVTADDGEGGTVTDSFEFAVTNPAPIAGDDALSASEDMAITGNVITASDSDPDGDVLTVIEVAGNPENVGLPISGSTGGVFTINADGSVTFDPNGDFDDLALGETATSTIAYMISDGEGGTDTAIVTVTIEGANDAPVVTGPLVEQNSADGSVAEPFDASTAFTDVDGDPLTFTATGLPEGLSIDPATGVITGSLPADASQGGENSDGVYVVEVTAIDPSGEAVSVFVTYTIENPAPVAVNDVISTPEDTPVSVNLLDNDSDPDGDALVLDAAALPNGTILPIGTPIELPEGELTILADGTVDFTPAPDFSGTVVFGYTVSDNEGGTDVGTVTLNVEPVNDTPVLVDPNDPNGPTDPEDFIPVQGGRDNVAVEPIDLTQFFGDPDPSDVLTISVDPSDLPEGLVFDPETGIISGTPAPNASQGGDPLNPGTYVVAVTVTDANGESVTTNLTYVLTNPAPIAGEDRLEVVEDTPTVLDLLANDTDPDGDALMITQINGTPVTVGVPTTLPSGGVVTLNTDGTVSYEPSSDFNGPDSFTYTISDGEGGTDVAMVNLEVSSVNDGPTATPELLGGPDTIGGNISSSLSGSLSITSEDGGEVSIPTAAVFVDPDGDTLTYSAAGLPEGLSIDPETGLITGTIDNSASLMGPYEVTLTATDSNGASVDVTFIFNVTNPAPVIGPVELPATPPVVGETVTIDVGAVTQDPDGDVLTFSAEDLPPGLSIDPVTGVITGTLTTPQTEPFVFTVTVSDGEGGTDQVELTLQVNEDGFIIPNDTSEFGMDLGILNEVDPYEFLEDQPIDLQRYFHERALDARDEYGRMFGDRGFRGGMVAAHVPAMGDECAYMVVEAVADDHNLSVLLGSSLSAVCEVNVRSWDVTMTDGTPLPAWINWPNGSDFMDVSRPADGETLGLKIRALLDNGRVGTISVDIDLHNGAVTQTSEAYAQGQTLQQQLALETLDMEERLAEADKTQDDLLKALTA